MTYATKAPEAIAAQAGAGYRERALKDLALTMRDVATRSTRRDSAAVGRGRLPTAPIAKIMMIIATSEAGRTRAS